MQAELLRFMQLARQRGVRISPAESMDALNAAQVVGFESPHLLKETLAMTLAKSVEEEALCKRCFDQFFFGGDAEANELGDNTGPDKNESHSQYEPLLQTENESLAQALQNSVAQALIQGDQTEIQARVAEALANLEVEKLQFFTQKGLYTRRLLDALGEAPLRQLSAQIDGASPEGQALKSLQSELQALAKAAIERAFDLNAAGKHDELMEEILKKSKLNAIERRHADRLKGLIQKLARKLTQKHRKRPKRTRRGNLHMIKTLRKGITHDGILFETFWRKTEKRKPQIIAVCDVSGSVAAYAKFLLMLLYYLQDVLPRTRSFAFAHDLGEVTELFQQYEVEKATEIVNWRYGGATDYGSSIEKLYELTASELTPQTTLIILGDARNNYGDPKFERLQELGERCRRIIWLNPESKSQWGSGDSEMLRYLRVCQTAHECNTLGQLERVIDELITITK